MVSLVSEAYAMPTFRVLEEQKWSSNDLRDLRARLGWRQADLARWLNVGETTVWGWERHGGARINTMLGPIYRPLLDYLKRWAADNTPEPEREVERVRKAAEEARSANNAAVVGTILGMGAVAFLVWLLAEK